MTSRFGCYWLKVANNFYACKGRETQCSIQISGVICEVLL